MPILEDDDMDDRAVLWRKLAEGPDGQPVFDEPEDVPVNWRETHREAIGADGTVVTITAQISLLESVPLGSRLWLAPDHETDAIEQWYTGGSAGQQTEVMRVETRNRTRDAKAIETRYSYGLAHDRDDQT